ncbi:hypothetical protein Naga_100658g1 [Nannochloropsis gaditana]|uniref:Uncharacterized protein n=1 Tax=Nannochloropsis gaditana TaxID=72520 RepID=W7SZC8_9STRA|nr:hypothetical protein Naga_100658g1 [Nannochloropsis gaditana]
MHTFFETEVSHALFSPPRVEASSYYTPLAMVLATSSSSTSPPQSSPAQLNALQDELRRIDEDVSRSLVKIEKSVQEWREGLKRMVKYLQSMPSSDPPLDGDEGGGRSEAGGGKKSQSLAVVDSLERAV